MINNKAYRGRALRTVIKITMLLVLLFAGDASASEIRGFKWNDSNGNGIKDLGEFGVENINICSVAENINICTFTNASGNYRFINLIPGLYSVYEIAPFGNVQTYPPNGNPYLINLNLSEIKEGIDFGNRKVQLGEIRGFKWNDSNGNGIKDVGEFGVENINICIFGATARCTFTNASGNYRFINLIPGLYRVYEILPPGRVQTYPPNGNSYFINLNLSEIKEGIDFSNRQAQPGEIRGFKWNDSNGNGIKDIGELGVENINICISGPNSRCTATNVSGNYRFMNLIPGYYTVYEILPPGRVQTFPAFNQPHFINLIESEIKEGIDFGNANASRIRGFKWNDSNGNGIKDIGEPGVENINIQLTRIISPGNESFVGSTLTNATGSYGFGNLNVGFYRVEELPTGRSQTYPENGSPHFINLIVGEVRDGVNFGNQPVPPGEIRGFKWNDSNGNSIKDVGEFGVENVNICVSPSWKCTLTDSSGNYSFPNVPVGTYTVYEYLPFGHLATTPTMVTVTVNSTEVKIVNFGNRLPVPPPSDVSVAQQSGTQNGVPTVFRPSLTILTIRKNLTNISNNVVAVNLTLKWSDGTIKTANMTEIDATNVWEANINSPFPPGAAQMTFKVDVAPAGPGTDDAIQIGDIIFIDPSGQIQNACTGAPIDGTMVTLLVEFPPGTGNFIISLPTNQIPPDNPLTTGADGMYSWMTVPGRYKVIANKTGYIQSESPTVSVPPPVFNLNISLTPTDGCAVQDNIPPEAVISFNTTTKDIQVVGKDAMDIDVSVISIILEDKENGKKKKSRNIILYTLTDDSGNTLNLTLAKNKEGNELKVEILKLVYTNATGKNEKTPSKNDFKVEYTLNKSSGIKELEQKIEVEEQFEVKADFNNKNGNTIIKIEEQSKLERNVTLPGLVTLKLETENGIFKFEY